MARLRVPRACHNGQLNPRHAVIRSTAPPCTLDHPADSYRLGLGARRIEAAEFDGRIPATGEKSLPGGIMSFRSPASFAKRQGSIAIGRLWQLGRAVYMTLLDNRPIDSVIRQEQDGELWYLDAQSNARRPTATPETPASPARIDQSINLFQQVCKLWARNEFRASHRCAIQYPISY